MLLLMLVMMMLMMFIFLCGCEGIDLSCQECLQSKTPEHRIMNPATTTGDEPRNNG